MCMCLSLYSLKYWKSDGLGFLHFNVSFRIQQPVYIHDIQLHTLGSATIDVCMFLIILTQLTQDATYVTSNTTTSRGSERPSLTLSRPYPTLPDNGWYRSWQEIVGHTYVSIKYSVSGLCTYLLSNLGRPGLGAKNIP